MASPIIDATKCAEIKGDGVSTLSDFLCDFNGIDTNKDLNTINSAANSFVVMAISFAGIVAFAMFLWGCFLYVTSFGEDAKAETAKKTLLWSIGGLAIVGLASLIRILAQKVF
ncbi:MAG: hypothetical protein WC227_00595 [Patescibacteria group bacterium]|jgi:hypothetical protein